LAEFLYSLDVSLFRFFNETISNSVSDKFFPFVTDVKNWHIAYIIVWFIVFFKGGKAGKITAVTALFLIAVSDQISSTFIKNIVGRIRPCTALEKVNILAGCTGSFSFPSSHAVNNFAIAVYFSVFFPKFRNLLFVIASVVAFSRIYCGVHYPSDVAGGAIIGAAIGYLFAIITKILSSKIKLLNIQE